MLGDVELEDGQQTSANEARAPCALRLRRAEWSSSFVSLWRAMASEPSERCWLEAKETRRALPLGVVGSIIAVFNPKAADG